ncbi:ABC transporter ATP-binding protein [Streptosporangium sp. NPDC020072]|uniref:ABC transporter ATP-binding protein n=1 Tax=Streptosporangium sp. NPDC020072 TaxID=3154788 RepID=UPI00342E1327
MSLLDVRNLRVRFASAQPAIAAVDGVSLTVEAGEVVALVGESGCGKSATALALLGLLPASARVEGEIVFDGEDLTTLNDRQLSARRGRDLAMVFQDPMTSLNPVVPIGVQITEVLLRHTDLSKAAAGARAEELLREVGIPDPRRRMRQYPHQLSGGMRQRVMIATAIACGPKLLIADEPTTALDVTIQAQVLELLARLARDHGAALLMITHDLGVVAGLADRVSVMYGGRVVETASAEELFRRPMHRYTRGLLASIPALDSPRDTPLTPIPGSPFDRLPWESGCSFASRCAVADEACMVPGLPMAEDSPGHRFRCVHPAGDAPVPVSAAVTARESAAPAEGESPEPLVRISDLRVRYPARRAAVTNRPVEYVRAVDGVSLDLPKGRTYGLVGESGCGKSSLGRALLRLEPVASGSVLFDGVDLAGMRERALRPMRRRMQMVFQDPMASLNPRQSVGDILELSLRVHGVPGGRGERRAKVLNTLDQVGLPRTAEHRYPHEFSGGQRQRVGIARAIILEPDLLIADEPVSALDVSVQAQIVNLLQEVKRTLSLTTLLIAHDLAVVRHMSDTVGVMYLGRLVEEADSGELFERPLHPYTVSLMSAVPLPDPVAEARRERIILSGDLPSPAAPPSGCPFHTRCPFRRQTRCAEEVPQVREVVPGHRVACHWAEDIAGLA